VSVRGCPRIYTNLGWHGKIEGLNLMISTARVLGKSEKIAIFEKITQKDLHRYTILV